MLALGPSLGSASCKNKLHLYLVTLSHTPVDAAMADTFLAGLALESLAEDVVFK